MRILGIDYGDSRCGFAITDLLHITVQGLETLNFDGNDKAILKKIDEYMRNIRNRYYCCWNAIFAKWRQSRKS